MPADELQALMFIHLVDAHLLSMVCFRLRWELGETILKMSRGLFLPKPAAAQTHLSHTSEEDMFVGLQQAFMRGTTARRIFGEPFPAIRANHLA